MDCESVDQTDAWTEAINKVLQTNVPRKKSVVLALAEKDQEVKEETEIKKEYDFEIEGGTVSDEDIQEEKPDVKDLDLKLKLGTKRLLVSIMYNFFFTRINRFCGNIFSASRHLPLWAFEWLHFSLIVMPKKPDVSSTILTK